VVEKSIAEDLPPGWVKELKITKNSKGIRKDPVWKNFHPKGYLFIYYKKDRFLFDVTFFPFQIKWLLSFPI